MHQYLTQIAKPDWDAHFWRKFMAGWLLILYSRSDQLPVSERAQLVPDTLNRSRSQSPVPVSPSWYTRRLRAWDGQMGRYQSFQSAFSNGAKYGFSNIVRM